MLHDDAIRSRPILRSAFSFRPLGLPFLWRLSTRFGVRMLWRSWVSRWCSNPRNWPQSQCRVPDRSNVRQPWGWGIADCSDCQKTSLCCTISVCLLYLMYLMLSQNSLYMKEKLLLSKQRWTAERYFRRLASCYAIYAEISRQIIQ